MDFASDLNTRLANGHSFLLQGAGLLQLPGSNAYLYQAITTALRNNAMQPATLKCLGEQTELLQCGKE